MVYTFADSSTSWLPTACADTLAVPLGDVTEVTDASPTIGAATEGNGEQLLKVGGYGPAPGAAPASASSSA